jgi:hypothetical protein
VPEYVITAKDARRIVLTNAFEYWVDLAATIATSKQSASWHDTRTTTPRHSKELPGSM